MRTTDKAMRKSGRTPSKRADARYTTPMESLIVSTTVHTSPQQFDKIMSLTKPRLAVGYHFQNDFDTQPIMLEETRKIYGGPEVFGGCEEKRPTEELPLRHGLPVKTSG